VVLLACKPVDVSADVCPPLPSQGFVSSERELALDSRFEMLGRVRPVVTFSNPTPAFAWPFQPAAFFARNAPGVSPQRISEGGLPQALTVLRERVRSVLDHSLSPVHAGVARALILGEAQAVDPELNEAIRTSGVSHVLAVSGMHVTVIAGALVWLLSALWLRTRWASFIEARRVSALLGVGLAPLVALFAGSSPSAMRAGIASSLTYAVWALGRRPNALSVAALAWIACTIGFPRDALHPGLILSVLATHSLLTMRSEQPSLRRALLESTRTWLATLPFLLVAFSTLPIVGIAANVVLAPFGTLLIPLVVVHVFTAWLLPFVAPASAAVFETSSGAFLVAARVFAQADPGFDIPPLSAVQAAALCLAAWGLLLTRTCKGARLLGLGCAMLFAFSEWQIRTRIADHGLEIRHLDVGQGDATFLETHDGKRLLIDAGGAPQGGPDPGARAVVPLLRALRVNALDVFVLSHPHPDHYGGLSALLEHVPIKELWDTGEACVGDQRGAACMLIERARAKGTRIRTPAELCAGIQHFSALQIEVLAPCPSVDETFSTNDNSFVLRMLHGTGRFLFMGDAEREREEQLVSDARSKLSADVLKVGHHGSRSSTTAALLEAVRPRLAIISAGRGNRFDHPHDEVTTRLHANVERTLRLDQLGGVVLRSDGNSLDIQTREQPNAIWREATTKLSLARE
jgi:competence protein ComEC